MCGTSDLGYADMQCVVLTWAMLLQGGAARMRLTRTATSRPQSLVNVHVFGQIRLRFNFKPGVSGTKRAEVLRSSDENGTVVPGISVQLTTGKVTFPVSQSGIWIVSVIAYCDTCAVSTHYSASTNVVCGICAVRTHYARRSIPRLVPMWCAYLRA
eukprot:3937070-Rhodomonas_salina.2